MTPGRRPAAPAPDTPRQPDTSRCAPPPRHADTRSHARRRRRLAAGALTLLLAGVGAGACGGTGGNDAGVRVTVPTGASFRQVADTLEARGLVGSARLFRWYAAFGGRDRAIKAGTYQLAADQSWGELLDALVAGTGLVVSVTIPEGFDLRRIVPRLARALEVPEDSVRAAVRDSAWRAERDIPAATLEGYLFPDTYVFAAGTTAREAVRLMLARFDAMWRPEWDARLAALGITRHQAVTMAALVEKEARVAAERPTIAAVYWNRVRIGMRLQADPTVQYALPEHVERLLFVHLEVDSPYNTYRHDGLPPGPIASPGAASLGAALHPTDVPYLFFVAHPDGHHEFTRTFQEHQRAIAMVRREARRRASEARVASPSAMLEDAAAAGPAGRGVTGGPPDA